jgi:hypothetical protein
MGTYINHEKLFPELECITKSRKFLDRKIITEEVGISMASSCHG